VLCHRILLTPEAELRDRGSTDVIEETVASVPVPQYAAAVRS
jgi:hypothetical protein